MSECVKLYTFLLCTFSTKFQFLHILAVLDQRSTKAGIYFSLVFFLKLVNLFLYILKDLYGGREGRYAKHIQCEFNVS